MVDGLVHKNRGCISNLAFCRDKRPFPWNSPICVRVYFNESRVDRVKLMFSEKNMSFHVILGFPYYETDLKKEMIHISTYVDTSPNQTFSIRVCLKMVYFSNSNWKNHPKPMGFRGIHHGKSMNISNLMLFLLLVKSWKIPTFPWLFPWAFWVDSGSRCLGAFGTAAPAGDARQDGGQAIPRDTMGSGQVITTPVLPKPGSSWPKISG
jgi:hypothetical protein